MSVERKYDPLIRPCSLSRSSGMHSGMASLSQNSDSLWTTLLPDRSKIGVPVSKSWSCPPVPSKVNSRSPYWASMKKLLVTTPV